MTGTTVITKGNHFVEIEPCLVFINNKPKHWRIKGTKKYFLRFHAAKLAANEILVQQSIPESEFRKRTELKVKLRNAKKVVMIYNCLEDTRAYVKKWDGTLYLETKKNLCSELNAKLEAACKKYKFTSAFEAIDLFYGKNIKTKYT